MKKQSNRAAKSSAKSSKKAPAKSRKSGIMNDDESLPGYPHYPQSEDIMGPLSEEDRLETDIENLSRSPKAQIKPAKGSVSRRKKSNPDFVAGTDADVTPEDIESLGDPDSDLNEGEDELLLPKLKRGPDLFGDDLDVPGSELDDDWEDTGSEDEENNYYSRGQD
jgi:hypothetical protein